MHQPAMGLLQRQVDQAVVRVVGHDLLQQATGHGGIGSAMKRGISTSSTREATSSSLILRSPIAATVAASATTRRALAGSESQAPSRRAMSAAASRSRITSSCRKFSAKNSSRLLPNSSFLRGTSAVCGIGQPERVPEQRGHGEPVGDGSHHARLGARVHEAEEPVLVQRGQVHDRGKQQQSAGDTLHPPQAGTPVRVRLRVRGQQRGSHRSRNLSIAQTSAPGIGRSVRPLRRVSPLS